MSRIPLRRPLPRILVLARRVVRNDHMVMSVLAVAVGAAAGGGAVAFRVLLDSLQFVAFGTFDERLVTFLADQPAWRIVAAPVVGGLIVGLYIQFVMGGRRAEGVPAVMAAVALKDARLPLLRGLHGTLVHATSLGFGASTGREGPVVHLGATLGSALGDALGLGRRMVRTLVGCGVAAAVAASFNAPIAGVFFALEVVIGHYALSAFAPVVLAAVTGTVIARMVYGDYPAFILPDSMEIASVLEFPAFLLLGLVSAIAAIAFMASVIKAEEFYARSPIPPLLRPASAGLILGVVALWLPELLGVGYEATDNALRENYDLTMLVVLIVAKIGATALCIGAGFGGGVFSPSLFLGAMVGGAFGLVATAMAPELSSGHGAYTLIGMGAVAGAVLGAPISTMLIIFELTGDYALTIAVMVAVSIASILTDQVVGKSLFTWQLARQGVELKGGREMRLLKGIAVRDVMKEDYATVRPDDPLSKVAETLTRARYGEVFVTDGSGHLVGLIMLADLATLYDPAHPETCPATRAAEIARSSPPVLSADEDIRAAVREMDLHGESHIPVIRSKDDPVLIGFLHEHDVMLAYHRAVLEARSEEQGLAPTDVDPLRR